MEACWMATIKFISNDGVETDIDIESGSELTIMQIAVNNGIQGIDAECGGALSCATCHVHFDNEWYEKLPEAQGMEKDMLEFVVEPKETSRLCCQVKITDELDGMVVYIPESQY
jgi:2Fe-2S ferredoxin